MNLRDSSKEGGGRSKGEKSNFHPKVNKLQTSTTYNVSNNSPLLTDENEFPSLSEISGKICDNSYSPANNFKYSDKLKSFYEAKSFQSEFLDMKHNNAKNVSDKSGNKTLNVSKNISMNEQLNLDKQNLNYKEVSVCSSQKVIKKEYVDFKKSTQYALQNVDKRSLSQSPKQNYYSDQLSKQASKKNLASKQTLPATKLSNFNFVSSSSKSISNLNHREISIEAESNSLNKSNGNFISKAVPKNNKFDNQDRNEDIQCNSKTKKKKKRKSKVKRQVLFQTGKITLLTPEIHSKILNQSGVSSFQNFKSTLTDINNEEEYPQLGISFMPSQKENSLKKMKSIAVKSQNEALEQSPDIHTSSEFASSEETSTEPVQKCVLHEKSSFDKKWKSDKAAHPSDPITVSIFDILFRDCKAKDKHKDEISLPLNASLRKLKSRKDVHQPHNLLDSSPALKRGKERENPKPKKPSHLKKIILLDRKIRREQFLMKNNVDQQEEMNEDGHGPESSADCPIQDGNPCFNELKTVFCDNFTASSCLDAVAALHLEDSNDLNSFVVQPFTNNQNACYDSLDHSKYQQSLKMTSKSTATSLTHFDDENTVEKQCLVQNMAGNCSVNKEQYFVNNENQHIQTGLSSEQYSQKKNLMNSVESNDSLLTLVNDGTKNSDKQRASKIILHTRNFREYCNHLNSKEIDEAVFALLDDLARFQDRMHQKNPVKARMKRRMVYGIKEIKKHIKLKKLKCIIIAPDLENVETEGGLNDVLKDIKSLAADHHIPCIFALGRKILGKVCHKSVPVSCVGVFSYEGSEVNFKKMIELQAQSMKDYAEILEKINEHITEEQAFTFIKAKKEAPETLHNLRSNFLREIFLLSEVKIKSFESDWSETGS